MNADMIPAISLVTVFNSIIEKKVQSGKQRTADNYRSCLNKLLLYLGEQASSFSLQDLTSHRVHGFTNWLLTQHPDNPRSADFYLRGVRSLYNQSVTACGLPLVSGDTPFTGVRLPKGLSTRRALSQEELQELFIPKLRTRLSPSGRQTLDILQFIFYSCGMVFQDVYNLRWEMISDDGKHISYLRSKTTYPIGVSLPLEAKVIMERYRQEGESRVFPFLYAKQMDGSPCSEQSALRRINRHATRIGKLAGLSLPLTTYVMRHTWATLMLETGKSVELISQCLGHTSIQTTQIYLSRISTHRIDMAVNDMYNRVLRPKRERKKKNNTTDSEGVAKKKQNINIGYVQVIKADDNADKIRKRKMSDKKDT